MHSISAGFVKSQRLKPVIFYIFDIVKKCHKETKTNNELHVLTVTSVNPEPVVKLFICGTGLPCCLKRINNTPLSHPPTRFFLTVFFFKKEL